MRHQMRGRKFGRTSSQRSALLKGLAASLIEHEQIQTTLEKAKDLRPFVEKLVTLCRGLDLTQDNNLSESEKFQESIKSLNIRRHAMKILGQKKLVQKLMTSLAERYKNRPGGYTRIVKTGFRYGDNASRAIIEFVDRDKSAKGAINRQAHLAEN